MKNTKKDRKRRIAAENRDRREVNRQTRKSQIGNVHLFTINAGAYVLTASEFINL